MLSNTWSLVSPPPMVLFFWPVCLPFFSFAFVLGVLFVTGPSTIPLRGTCSGASLSAYHSSLLLLIPLCHALVSVAMYRGSPCPESGFLFPFYFHSLRSPVFNTDIAHCVPPNPPLLFLPLRPSFSYICTSTFQSFFSLHRTENKFLCSNRVLYSATFPFSEGQRSFVAAFCSLHGQPRVINLFRHQTFASDRHVDSTSLLVLFVGFSNGFGIFSPLFYYGHLFCRFSSFTTNSPYRVFLFHSLANLLYTCSFPATWVGFLFSPFF